MSNLLKELAGGNLNLNAKPGRGRQFFPYIVTELYTNSRGVQMAEVKEVEKDGYTGWCTAFSVPDDLPLTLGTVVLVGVDGFNHVGFIMVNGRVVRNYDAEDYDREHREMLDRNRRHRQELLDANREQWTAVESYLSEQSRARIQYFRENSEDFELEGWGYELCIGELTDMLVESNLEETDEIKESLAYQSCSGNQFGFAKALAREILAGGSIAGTVAGLSPITGLPTY